MVGVEVVMVRVVVRGDMAVTCLTLNVERCCGGW